MGRLRHGENNNERSSYENFEGDSALGNGSYGYFENVGPYDTNPYRGEDTECYGEATDWLQPGTELGDAYQRMVDHGETIDFSNNDSDYSYYEDENYH